MFCCSCNDVGGDEIEVGVVGGVFVGDGDQVGGQVDIGDFGGGECVGGSDCGNVCVVVDVEDCFDVGGGGGEDCGVQMWCEVSEVVIGLLLFSGLYVVYWVDLV